MSSRRCKNSVDVFCYICGNFVLSKQKQNITDFVKRTFHDYFGFSIELKSWTPHVVCTICVEQLRQWTKGQRKSLPFGIPMMWREPTNHVDDCYFCCCNVKGFNAKNKSKISYPNLNSVTRPIPHGPEVPIPPPFSVSSLSSTSSEHSVHREESMEVFELDTNQPELFTQAELNDLTRDLGLSKDAAQLLGSRLHAKHLLAPGTQFAWYRKREKDFVPYFSQEGSLVYCNNIPAVIENLGAERYDPSSWRLFIDSSKRSLKGVLLHNSNQYASVPIAHSVHLKETYENLELLLNKIQYQNHGWQLCGDLKIICMLLGQQSGFTKYPCFLCEWDSRARLLHYVKKQWTPRDKLEPGTKNILRKNLVDSKKILLPPLHIKLGLMKQFVKALNKEGDCFKYLCQKFSSLSDAKLKEGIFIGPHIRTLMNDKEFETTMIVTELEAWRAFKDVVNNFLGNHKHPNYKNIVATLLNKFHKLGCNMSIKLHFLDSHLDFFPENLGDFSEEQGERFHQDIKNMETRYQGRWNVNMMADYCWSIKRDVPDAIHKKITPRRSFTEKRKRYHTGSS